MRCEWRITVKNSSFCTFLPRQWLSNYNMPACSLMATSRFSIRGLNSIAVILLSSKHFVSIVSICCNYTALQIMIFAAHRGDAIILAGAPVEISTLIAIIVTGEVAAAALPADIFCLWGVDDAYSLHCTWLLDFPTAFLLLIPSDKSPQEEMECADVHCFSSCEHSHMIEFPRAQLEGQNRLQTADELWRSQAPSWPARVEYTDVLYG